METIIEKFLEIAIILVAAKFGAELMRRINQPAVIGELVAESLLDITVLDCYHILKRVM